ncbi:THAP domain-containing protein 1-like [Aricia agestis]|uniref:THAP domain-containing protein 1-like n=1 Tax=Aricia agestis TaxID=91739 RepID=UPI001C207AC0|nr:THAP domain-containing protein 1-like [Aricia agestis]
MPQSCAVPTCSTKTGGHKFPKDEIRLKQWLVAIRRERYTPSYYSRVCKDHFTKDDYELPKESYLVKPRLALKKDAVPSRFPWNEVTNEGKKRKRQLHGLDGDTGKQENIEKTSIYTPINTNDIICGMLAFDCEGNDQQKMVKKMQRQQDKSCEVNTPTTTDKMDTFDQNSPKSQRPNEITSMKIEKEENPSDHNELDSLHPPKPRIEIEVEVDPQNLGIVKYQEYETSVKIEPHSPRKEDAETTPTADSQSDETQKSKCTLCDRDFESEGQLRTHQTKCAASFMCKLCLRHFDTLSHLTMHILTAKSHIPVSSTPKPPA